MTRDTVAAAMALLQSMIEHKRKARTWEQEFYPISNGSSIQPGTPDVRSPEVQVLINAGFVQFVGTCSNDSIPDDSLRLLDINQPKVEELIRQYADQLQSAGAAGELKEKVYDQQT